MGSTNEELNKQVLQQMQDAGDDLSTSRPIDFSFALPDEASAALFAAEMRSRGVQSAIEETGCVLNLPWDVVVTIGMCPDLQAIAETERDLGEAAEKHGGLADGWVCGRRTTP